MEKLVSNIGIKKILIQPSRIPKSFRTFPVHTEEYSIVKFIYDFISDANINVFYERMSLYLQHRGWLLIP